MQAIVSKVENNKTEYRGENLTYIRISGSCKKIHRTSSLMNVLR